MRFLTFLLIMAIVYFGFNYVFHLDMTVIQAAYSTLLAMVLTGLIGGQDVTVRLVKHGDLYRYELTEDGEDK